jgi:hypothetical protein
MALSALILLIVGMTNAAKTPIIAIATSSSTSVKPSQLHFSTHAPHFWFPGVSILKRFKSSFFMIRVSVVLVSSFVYERLNVNGFRAEVTCQYG